MDSAQTTEGAVITAEGTGLTVTFVVAGSLEQLPIVATTVYVPEAAGVAEGIVGFWADDVNPLGPVQE